MSTVYEPPGDWVTDPGDPRLAVLWPGSEGMDEEQLAFLLHVSTVQCSEFAPALPEDAPVPDNWAAAQVMQARALYRAGVVGTGDQIGEDGMSVTIYPMDRSVKALLRPRKGKPYFGGRRTV